MRRRGRYGRRLPSMSEKLPKGSSQRGQIRAGDLDRDEVLKMLQDAYAADQLSREEFEDRQQFCLKARYVGDLSDLISDLPGGARWRKEEPSDEPSERIIVTDNIYPYSEVVVLRCGTVRMSPSMSTIRSVTVLGGSSIHIEDIMAPGVVIELNLKSVLGGFTVYLPWRVQVINRSINIMSTVDIEPDADGDGANGAVIINGWHVLGGLNIRLEKYLKEEREKRKRNRYQRRSWR